MNTSGQEIQLDKGFTSVDLKYVVPQFPSICVITWKIKMKLLRRNTLVLGVCLKVKWETCTCGNSLHLEQKKQCQNIKTFTKKIQFLLCVVGFQMLLPSKPPRRQPALRFGSSCPWSPWRDPDTKLFLWNYMKTAQGDFDQEGSMFQWLTSTLTHRHVVGRSGLHR